MAVQWRLSWSKGEGSLQRHLPCLKHTCCYSFTILAQLPKISRWGWQVNDAKNKKQQQKTRYPIPVQMGKLQSPRLLISQVESLTLGQSKEYRFEEWKSIFFFFWKIIQAWCKRNSSSWSAIALKFHTAETAPVSILINILHIQSYAFVIFNTYYSRVILVITNTSRIL